MVRSNAAESFEWPPVKDAQTSQVVELSSQGGEPTQRPSESVASARVAVRREEGPVPNLPERPQEDVHVALRHLLQQRASAAKASAQALPLPRSQSHISSRVVPAVLVAVSLTALLEAAYIVRTLWRQPTSSAANSSQTPRPHDNSATAPAPERVAGCAPWEQRTSEPGERCRRQRRRNRCPTTGRLVFRSDPSGAQVFVDGRLYGVTPLTLGTVVAGEHRILLKRNATELRTDCACRTRPDDLRRGANASRTHPRQVGSRLTCQLKSTFSKTARCSGRAGADRSCSKRGRTRSIW